MHRETFIALHLARNRPGFKVRVWTKRKNFFFQKMFYLAGKNGAIKRTTDGDLGAKIKSKFICKNYKTNGNKRLYFWNWILKVT